MANQNNSAIQVRDLEFFFDSPNNVLFSGLSFEANLGERVCLLGPSGSGKTTLLKVLAGILKPKGRLEIIRKPISMSFQQGGLLDCFNVFENVEFPLKELTALSREKRRDLVEDLLQSLGLLEHASKRIHELSGGMQKRVSLARALSVSPQILLMDEPSGGLDPISTFELSELILSHQKRNNTCLLFSTSDLHFCFSIATHILFLCSGVKAQKIEKSEFVKKNHPAVQQFLSGTLEGPIRSWDNA